MNDEFMYNGDLMVSFCEEIPLEINNFLFLITIVNPNYKIVLIYSLNYYRLHYSLKKRTHHSIRRLPYKKTYIKILDF